MKDVVYIINGYTNTVGQWEVEVFRNFEDALAAFKEYVYEYNATELEEEENDTYKVAECREGRFWLEDVDVL